MEPITSENVRAFFEERRSELGEALDGVLVWSFFLTGDDIDKVHAAAETLEGQNYEIGGVFENEEESGQYILVIDKDEVHNEESLLARCTELEAFAAANGLTSLDGMEASPIGAELPSEGNVANPELKEMLVSIAADGNSEGKTERFAELLNGAFFVVPVLKVPEGDGEMQLCVCDDDAGNEYLPVFTDLEELRTWVGDLEADVITISAGDAWSLALSHEENKGVVLNPGSDALPLHRELLEELLSEG